MENVNDLEHTLYLGEVLFCGPARRILDNSYWIPNNE